MTKELGKIEKATFGYSDYLFGLHLTLSGAGWGVSKSYAYSTMAYLGYERIEGIILEIQGLLDDAKVKTIDKLIGKPVEVTFENNLLKSLRILTEVL